MGVICNRTRVSVYQQRQDERTMLVPQVAAVVVVVGSVAVQDEGRTLSARAARRRERRRLVAESAAPFGEPATTVLPKHPRVDGARSSGSPCVREREQSEARDQHHCTGSQARPMMSNSKWANLHYWTKRAMRQPKFKTTDGKSISEQYRYQEENHPAQLAMRVRHTSKMGLQRNRQESAETRLTFFAFGDGTGDELPRQVRRRGLRHFGVPTNLPLVLSFWQGNYSSFPQSSPSGSEQA